MTTATVTPAVTAVCAFANFTPKAGSPLAADKSRATFPAIVTKVHALVGTGPQLVDLVVVDGKGVSVDHTSVPFLLATDTHPSGGLFAIAV